MQLMNAKEQTAYRNDLSNYAHRFVSSVAEVVAGNRNSLAVDFIRPAGVVAVALGDQVEIRGVRHCIWLSIVQRLETLKRTWRLSFYHTSRNDGNLLTHLEINNFANSKYYNTDS